MGLDVPRKSGIPKIRAVTFDMDGLMFNTEDLYDYVTNVVLARRGKAYTREQKLKMMGLPGPQAFAVLQAELSLEDSFPEFQSEIDEVFEEVLPTRIEKMPGLDQLLNCLERRGIPKAVATSSHRAFAERALGKFNLIERFEFVLCGCDVTHGKPHPEIYLTAAERLNVDPENMLALEDSVNGSRAAVAAGAITIAVPTDHSRDQDFSHVCLVVDSLDDAAVLSLFD
jgi:HAD superfamily hydrolase (TIGR01509 family)